jgi:hypothetical protein
MVGIEDLLMALIGTGVLSDELTLAEEPQVIGGEVEGEIGAGGIFGGNAVAIGLEGDAELTVGASGLNAGTVIGMKGQGQAVGFVGGEESDGLFSGLGMDADVGDGFHPDSRLAVEIDKAVEVQSIEEVAFDVAAAVFDAAFFVRGADVAGFDGKAIMSGEIGILGMRDRGAVSGMIEDGGLAVIDDDGAGDGAEVFEGIFLCGKEVFERLFEGELDVEHAAVAEDHDEGIEAALEVAERDGATSGEVDLGGLAGGEGEGEEGGVFRGSNSAQVIAEDGAFSRIPLGLKSLEDLGNGKIVVLERQADHGFIGIEFTGAVGALGPRIPFLVEVLADGVPMEAEFRGDLPDGETEVLPAFLDLTKGVIIDHGSGSWFWVEELGKNGSEGLRRRSSFRGGKRHRLVSGEGVLWGGSARRRRIPLARRRAGGVEKGEIIGRDEFENLVKGWLIGDQAAAE